MSGQVDLASLRSRLLGQGLEPADAERIAAQLKPRLEALASVPLSALEAVAPAVEFAPRGNEGFDVDG